MGFLVSGGVDNGRKLGRTKQPVLCKSCIWDRRHEGKDHWHDHTKAEKGNSGKGETPQYAAVGSNTLNEITVLRATRALFLYVRQWMAEQGIFEQPGLSSPTASAIFPKSFVNWRPALGQVRAGIR